MSPCLLGVLLQADALDLLLTASDKRDLEGFAGAVLLQAVGEGEGFVHFVVLKNVETAVQADLPAVIGQDVTGVQAARGVELPGEFQAYGTAGLLYLFEVLFLLVAFEFVLGCHQVNGNLLVGGLVFDDGFQELHEIARLIVHSDIRVSDRDLCRAAQVRTP